jgi:hydroxyacylglutathione hydrolase
MAEVSLEDNFMDILGKAQRGLNLSDAVLAKRAGFSEQELNRVKAGEVVEEVLVKAAAVLGLGPRALVDSARNAWVPNAVNVPGLATFTTAYGGMTVNAYIVWDSQTKEAAAFDTGADAEPMLEFLRDSHLVLKHVFLTHSHGDHIAGLERLKRETGASGWISELEPARGAEGFVEGRVFPVGRLQVTTRLTSGHSSGGTTYLVSGLGKPLAVVGDALFAGSMGSGMVSYANALENNRKKVLSLPDETVVCPGHGPLTTVGEERAHNPFFAEQGC